MSESVEHPIVVADVRDKVSGEKRIGAAALQSTAPRSGTNVTTGLAALNQLRAEHHGWSNENPPRLERVARVVKFFGH